MSQESCESPSWTHSLGCVRIVKLELGVELFVGQRQDCKKSTILAVQVQAKWGFLRVIYICHAEEAIPSSTVRLRIELGGL